MIILLLIFIGLFACRIPDVRIRNFIYISLVFYFLVSVYYFLLESITNVECCLKVRPNSEVYLWTIKPVCLLNCNVKDYNNTRKVISSDNGDIIYNITNSTINLNEEKIYYCYVSDEGDLSTTHCEYIKKYDSEFEHDVNEIQPPASSNNEPESISNISSSNNDSIADDNMKQTLGNVIDEKIEKSTIRRVVPITSLEPVLEENSEDLVDTSTEKCLDKIYGKNIVDMKQYDKPVEAILNDRTIGKSMKRGLVYENDPEMYDYFSKYT